MSSGKGVLVHYAETHDNDRIARKGRPYARMRLALSALTSFTGAWGITNGVEWLATEKINVHKNTGLNWATRGTWWPISPGSMPSWPRTRPSGNATI